MGKMFRFSARKPRVAGSIPDGDIQFRLNFTLVFLPYSSAAPLHMKSSVTIRLLLLLF